MLQFERDSLANNRSEAISLAPLAKQYLGADERGRIADRDLRQRIVNNDMRARAYAQTMRRTAQDLKSNEGVSAAVSVLKNLGSDISQERAELVVEILGNLGLGWEGEEFSADEIEATRAWLHSKAFSIYGGSHEIQNNITAKRVLGLPG